MSINYSTRYGTRYGVRVTRSGVSFGKRIPGGNLPHGDPKLARLGVRQTPRAWAGYGGSETVTAEEEALLGERIWQTSSAAEAAASGETALITAEEAFTLGEVGAGSVIYTLGWGAIAAGFAAAVGAGFAAYELYELSHDTKPKEHPMAGITKVATSMDVDSSSSSMDVDPSSSIGLGGKRKYDELSHDTTTPIRSGGDFSGLVTTFYNPVTGSIIGYKGIPRKRRFTSLDRYSSFWKEQNRLSTPSVLVGPSQA